MTRLYTDGAEMGDLLAFDYHNGVSINVGGYSGIYSYYADQKYFLKNVTEGNEFYVRFYYTTGNPNLWGYMVTWRNGGTELGSIRISNTPYNWVAYVGGTLVITGSRYFSNNTWYLIEVHIKLDNTNGKITLRINGTQEFDYTGDTMPDSNTTINNFSYNFIGGNSGSLIDDIAINDINGSEDNSWCGTGMMVKITPSGSGLTNQFLNSGGVSGSSNYLYVDEYPHDGDTTFVYCSASNVGFQDQYKMSSFSGAGKTIKRIFSEARIKEGTAGGNTIKLGYFPSGGTDQLSGSIILSTVYSRIVGTSASANPVTGLAWTEGDINALEFVAEI